MLLVEFNLVMIILTTFLVYLPGMIFFRHYARLDGRPWKDILIECAIFLGTGAWISFLECFYFMLMVSRTLGYIFLLDERLRLCARKPLHRGQLVRAGFFRFLLLVVVGCLVTFQVVVVVGRFLGLDIAYALSLIAAGLLLVAWSARDGIPHYRSRPSLKPLLRSRQPFLALFLVCAFVAAMITVPLPAGANSLGNPGTGSTGIQLKVMTFNILYAGEDGTANEWQDRKDDVAAYIDGLDLDVFGLQEVFRVQADYLNATLSARNYRWVGTGRETPVTLPNGTVQTGEHDVIFYDADRFLLLGNGTLWYSDTPDIPSRTWLTETIKRTFVHVHLKDKVTGIEFFFYNTHFGFYPEFHVKASIMLNDDITTRTGNLPVIVTGDFNMPPIFPFYSFLEGFGKKPLYNAFRLAEGMVDPQEIDFILVSSGVRVNSIHEDGEANAGPRWLSDHDPVIMSCTVRTTA